MKTHVFRVPPPISRRSVAVSAGARMGRIGYLELEGVNSIELFNTKQTVSIL